MYVIPRPPNFTLSPYTTLFRSGEAAIGNQGACLAQTGALKEGGRVQHLLHARASSWALVADDDDIASLHFALDRKSTRLNSSHVAISYAVFCLKKKK